MDTPFYPLPHSTLSTFQPNNSCVKWHNEYQDRTFPERDMENTQDGNPGGWFRITVSILTKIGNVQERQIKGSCVGLI